MVHALGVHFVHIAIDAHTALVILMSRRSFASLRHLVQVVRNVDKDSEQ
jgi:hypothetical protein